MKVLSTPADALERLTEDSVDCLVSTYRLGTTDGLALLESVREIDETLPFVLTIEGDTTKLLNRALSAGVTDVVHVTEGGEWISLVANRIESAVRTHRQTLELERYRLLVEAVPDGVYALDDELRYQFVNQSMADLLEYTRAELEGSHVALINDEAAIERAKEARRRALEDDELSGAVYNDHVTASGKRIPSEVLFRAVVEDGEFQGTVGILRDITDRLERERELERQNDRLGEFASIVSHDLKNPLMIAMGNLDLVEETTDDDALEEATFALERMYDLIDDLLALARQGRVIDDRERLELASVIDAALLTVDTNGATIELDDDFESMTVVGDETRLRELLENLVRNSVEHSSTSRSLADAHEDAVEHSSTSPASQAQRDAVEHNSTTRSLEDELEDGAAPITIWIGPLEDGAGFYVEDDGPGIPEDERERVFESGYTTNEGGTGFGLNIVEEIADAHGWTVRVTDGRTGGARFDVCYDE